MNRSKLLPKLLILVSVGLLIFIPAVAAWQGSRKTTVRPIEDWLIANADVGGHIDFDKNIYIFPQGAPWFPDFVPISDCLYDGYILERSLKDNKLSITVYLKVEDILFYVGLMPFIPFNEILVFKGIMQYRWIFNFIIDLDLYPEDHIDKYGNVRFAFLFNYLGNPEGMGVDLEYVFLYGRGEGEFLESWNSWDAGQTAKVNTMMCYLWKGEFLNLPKYNLYGLGELVLIDRISFRKI